ncbi:hypothetical protein PF005_g21439 [Phytophthora fragariae]|uniref:Uncharacterized protein n=1 Tax=Phytophthora fragariae TaxID=53985 RepID=A0A6A3S032_9STRA|nr:hypothetical protein PF006_g21206 [Phytophthora fragariae]KAE9185001.1 hypothetical protein PF005_g21439 [Phytophthora fragariae]
MKTGKPARPTRRSPRLAVAVNNDDDNNDIDDARVSDHSPRRAEQDDGQGDGSHEDAPPHQRDENNDVVTHNDDELAARVPAIANDELDDNAGNNDAGHVHHGDDDGTEIEGEESPSINTQVTDTVATSIATMAMALQQLTTMVGNLQPPTRAHEQPPREAVVQFTDAQTTHTRVTASADDQRERRSQPPPPTRTAETSRPRGRRRSSRRSTRHHGSPSPSDSSSSSSESSSSSSDASGESNHHGEESEDSHASYDASRGRRRGARPRRKNVKDLDLPTFTPSPDMPVSTWIDRVDLALKGAEMSGRGKWSDHELYFILGNKLLENAASWWVDINRRRGKN